MEDVPHQYEMPYDPLCPLICFDGRPCFLIGDAGGIIPMSPGKAKRCHYGYEKNGSCVLLTASDPHRGFRYTGVRDRRTAVDYAQFMQNPVNLHYPHAHRIRPVQDSLSTHTPGSFHETVSPPEALELSQKFGTHYTPEKGSWPDMAEIEFSAISGQCLNRRLPNTGTLRKEVLSWADERNSQHKTADWKFPKNNAREKLKRHYSNIKKT